MLRWLAGLMLGGLGMGAVGAAPAGQKPVLSGKIAYIRNGMACIAPAAGGRELILPESKGVAELSLSPTGSSVIYFVRRPDTRPLDDYGYVTRGYVSRSPFTRALPLPAPLDRAVLPRVLWSGDGKLAFIDGEKAEPGAKDPVDLKAFQGTYHSSDGSFRPGSHRAESTSHDGRVTAWTEEWHKILVDGPDSDPPATLFASGRPEPIIDALRKARHPERIRPLLKVTHESRQHLTNWALGPPALMPDGKKLFFAGNAGDWVGATGGTNYCFFAADLQTKKLAVLSRLGLFETCRIPLSSRVSPDGKRLLFHFQRHGSAIENPCSVHVVDLLTQETRELINRDPMHGKDANFVGGDPCWSPDGRYVAVSVYYYRIAEDGTQGTVIRPWVPGKGYGKALSTESWEPREEDYELQIFEASTGRKVRTLPHATSPTWAR